MSIQEKTRNLGLRGKLVLLITLPMLVVNLICLIAFTNSRIHQIKLSLVDETRSVVQALSQDFERLYRTGDQSLTTDLVDRLASVSSIEQAIVAMRPKVPMISE